MKKITTNTLSRILSVLPELNRVEQLHVLGGTSETESGVTGYYSFDTMLDLIGRGDWTGGCVEGIGYIGEEASTYQTGCYTYEAMLREMYYGTWAGGWVDHSGYVKGDVTMTGYYTLVDMEKMITEGTWNGGYVEDFGYVEAEGITGNYSTGIYSEQEMVDQMFSNEWKGGWVNGEYLDADYVVTGMYRTADEILEAMCYGNWYGGWLENSGYIGDNITGYAGNRVYSSSEMSDMQNNGLWSGGWVFGSGYINGGDGSYEDGVTGAYDPDGLPVTGVWYNSNTVGEMFDNGTWSGGYVDGLGYVGEITTVTGYFAEGNGLDAFLGFVKTVADEAIGLVDNEYNDLVYTATKFGYAFFEGFSYMALDIKYNGWDHFGEGRGDIPVEEVLELNEKTHHAYNFTFSGGFDKVDTKEEVTVEDFARFTSALIGLFPGGSTTVSVGERIGKKMVGLAECELVKRAIEDLIEEEE